MDNERYAEGYRRTLEYVRARRETVEMKELMNGPREWASFFDSQLFSHLSHFDAGDILETDAALTRYEEEWCDVYLDDITQQSRHLAFYNPNASIAVNELNFHVLSRDLMPIWRRALLPEIYPELTTDDIESMQNRLAYKGLDLVQTRKDAVKWQRIEKVRGGLVRSLSGQLTEIDAAIVMLEIQKAHPHLLVLPAPTSFESATQHNRSADFIIVDTLLGHSRGIQVKTNLAHPRTFRHSNGEILPATPIREYDSTYITMIDGMADFGSSQMRTIHGEGEVLVSNPGQVSVNYVADKNNASLQQARLNIENRILTDLYK